MSKRTPEEIIHSVERYQRGETSQGAEAKRLGVSQQTFRDWIRKHETFGIDGFEHGQPCVRKFTDASLIWTAVYGKIKAQ